MKTKKVTKKTVSKKVATKKPEVKAVAKKKPVLRDKVAPSIAPLDEKALQEKYSETVAILHQLHNAITLALSLTNEFDNKTPLQLVEYALSQYKEFSELSPAQVEALRAESEVIMKQIEQAFPEMEGVVAEPASKQKKELMN